MKTIRICEICGRTSNETRVDNNRLSGKTLCERHAAQWKKYGKITDPDTEYIRKQRKWNEITVNSNIATMKIIRRNGDIKYTIIDADDVERVYNHCWRYGDNGYVSTTINGKLIYLHRFITGYDGKLDIDHINKNKLDNRKENLRIVQRVINILNKYSEGVSFRKDRNKYRAYISLNGKQISLGLYETYNEARKAREAKEIEIINTLLSQESFDTFCDDVQVG